MFVTVVGSAELIFVTSITKKRLVHLSFPDSRFEAFIYKEGFARLSTHLYNKGDIGNRFIHLTNSR